MSKNFAKVQSYYKEKLWGVDRVRAAVGKWITAEEFKLIVGLDY